MSHPNATRPPVPGDDMDTDAGAQERARRDALRKLAALGAWTPPAMLTLLVSSRASAESMAEPPNWPP